MAAPADRGLRRVDAGRGRRAVRREGNRTQSCRPVRQRRVQRAPRPQRWIRTAERRTPTPAQPHQSPTQESAGRDDEVARLRARVAELQRERDHLVAIVDILQEISSSLHFVDILQAIARKFGDAFGLDRCAIFLSGEQDEVRLVASYEDPTIRNLVVDLNRYPELKRAFDIGETVFIPDAANDPMLRRSSAPRHAQRALDRRGADPMAGLVIGAIFLRTERDAEPFTDADVRFCQVVASLTAKALRNAHRFETLLHGQKDVAGGTASLPSSSASHSSASCAACSTATPRRDDHAGQRRSCRKASDEELERLVTVRCRSSRRKRRAERRCKEQGSRRPARRRAARAAGPGLVRLLRSRSAVDLGRRVRRALSRAPQAIESEYPNCARADSPTQRVGADRRAHSRSTASRPDDFARNAFNEEELAAWEERIVRLAGDDVRRAGYSCELKIDGGAIALTYLDGVLVKGATRGNGTSAKESRRTCARCDDAASPARRRASAADGDPRRSVLPFSGFES